MDDQKEYGDVFAKDSRNRHETHNGKKGTNHKQVVKRQMQTQKRQAKQEVEVEQDSEKGSVQKQKGKRYDNGKPKKVLKQQQAWADSEQEDKNGKNKKVKQVQKERYCMRH